MVFQSSVKLKSEHFFLIKDDHKIVTKRKTELGGAFSVASWILFVGLFAA